MSLRQRVEALEVELLGTKAPGAFDMQETVGALRYLSPDELDALILAGDQAQAGDVAAAGRQAELWSLARDRRRWHGKEYMRCGKA